MEELRKEAERKHSHLGVPERGGKEGRDCWRFRIIKEVGLEAFYREQMAERGRMGVREEVERRTGTAGEQRGRERETEKEVGKQINQMKWKQLLCRCGRGLDPDEC